MPIIISNNVSIADDEIEWKAIRAQGAGGQNVKTFCLIRPVTRKRKY